MKLDEAFSEILMKNGKSLDILYSKNHTEVGAAVNGSDGGGPYFWCVLFSNDKSNSSFTLEGGMAKISKPAVPTMTVVVAKDGPLGIGATSTGSNSTISKFIHMVEDAQSNEAPIQRLADAIAGPFVYSVMTLSLATFAFWYILTLLPFKIWVMRDLRHSWSEGGKLKLIWTLIDKICNKF